jgi:MFS family permease
MVRDNDNLETPHSRRYLIYLTGIALAGWALASYDFNIFTSTLPLMQKSLHFSTAEAGSLAGIIYLGMFVMVLIYGPLIDKYGRKLMFQLTLLIAAITTGFTSLVVNFAQLAGLRFVADGSSFGELPTGLTLITEESPPKYRGILYGFVQGGWPLGVFITTGLFLALVGPIGWRGLYVLGVIPLVAVLIGRRWVKESPRYISMKRALAGSKDEKYKVNTEKAKHFTYRQLFEKDLIRQTLALNSAWMLYTFSFVTTNIVITAIMVSYYGITAIQAASILFISSGIGYFAYPLAGWYGGIIGRRNAWVISAIAMPILAIIFLMVAKQGNYYSILLPYIPLYFFSNGTFASPGFMYVAESFPTRVRGGATSFSMALIAASYAIGGFLFDGVLSTSHSYPVTWIVLAVILPFGALTMILGKNVKPTQEVETIST